jgi:PIN domain nuclease of toxin-antitoxin system
MKPVLLDTHVWIWLALAQSDKFSVSARTAIQASRQRWIAAISCWELAKLVEKQRIGFSIPLLTWIERALVENEIRIAPLSPAIAVESTHLEGFHQDPADQMIVATARVAGWPVVSADHRIRDYPGVETIW